MTQASTRAWLALAALGLIWGASFMGAKFALSGFGPMTVALLRIVIAAVILSVVALALHGGLPAFKTATDRRIWIHILGMAIFTNALPFCLLNWGQTLVTSGFAGITMASVPLFVLPLAHFLVPGEVLSRRKVVGFAIGFVGVLILIGPSNIFGGSGGNMMFLAQLACVGAAACYATGSIITRLCPPVPTVQYSAAGLLLGALFLAPIALSLEVWPQNAPAQAWAGVIYLGLMPTALATLLLVWVINTEGPSFMSLVNYQVPVWAVILGVVILSEPLPGSFVGALVLILLGLGISQRKRKMVQTRP